MDKNLEEELVKCIGNFFNRVTDILATQEKSAEAGIQRYISIEEAAYILHEVPHSVRCGLIYGRHKFGTVEVKGKRKSYLINPKLFFEETGATWADVQAARIILQQKRLEG